MIVRYWHPFQEVESLRRQFDRVFNEIGGAIDTAPTAWTPAVQLVETENAYRLTVHLAGVDPNAIDVQVTREAVSISGDRPQPEATDGDRILYDGIAYGSFRRVVNLPDIVENDAVSADFTDGVLTLTLPKAVEALNKVVKVTLGQRDEASEDTAEALAAH